MSDTTTTEAAEVAEDTTTDVAGESTADNTDATDTGEHDDGDWEAKFEMQKKVNRDLERKLKSALPKDEAEKLRTTLAELQAAAEGREKEFAAEQERRQIEADALSKANERILKAEVRAAAATKLADPADALRFLDLSSLEVGDDGEVDTAAVSAAIDDLIARKPYLAAQGGRRFPGGADGGTRKETRPSQLTQSDLDRMSPEQIVHAKSEGRLNDLLGIK